jgi:hypothetical protein
MDCKKIAEIYLYSCNISNEYSNHKFVLENLDLKNKIKLALNSNNCLLSMEHLYKYCDTDNKNTCENKENK